MPLIRQITALAVLLCGLASASQLEVNCATNQACTAVGPINTHTGDTLPTVGYKVNTNFAEVYAAITSLQGAGLASIPPGNLLCNATGFSATPAACGQLPSLSNLPSIASGTLLGNASGSVSTPVALTALPAGIAVSLSSLTPIANGTLLCNGTGAAAAPSVCTALPSLSNLPSIAGGTLLGNSTGSPNSPTALSALPFAVSLSGLQTISAGTIVGNPSGSSATPTALSTLPSGVTVALSNLPPQAAGTLLGNPTGGPAAPIAVSTLPAGVTIAAASISAGTLPSGVVVAPSNLSAGSLPSGVTVPTANVAAGTLPTGVAVPYANLPAIAAGTLLGNTGTGSASPSSISTLPTGISVPLGQVGAITQGIVGNSGSSSATPTVLVALPANVAVALSNLISIPAGTYPCNQGSTAGPPTGYCPISSSAAPAEAQAAGYTQNTWSSNAFSSTTVDLSNTCYNATTCAGFQWYHYNLSGATPCTTDVVVQSDNSVILNGDGSCTTGPNGELVSASRNKTGGTTSSNWHGTAFGGGQYVEAYLKFANQNNTGTWPAFWFQPQETSITTGNTCYDTWGGSQACTYHHSIEVDAMEYFYNSGSQIMGAALHESWGIYNSTCTGFCSASSALTHFTIPSDLTVYHKYGALFVPATASTNGYIAFYVDDVLQSTQSYSQFAKTNTPPPTGQTWQFGAVDTFHYVVILGTATAAPMRVLKVNVWQANNSSNVSN